MKTLRTFAFMAGIAFCEIAVFADEPVTTDQVHSPDASLNDNLPLDGAEADDLDALLDLADKDFGRVAQVDVSAPALNVEVTTVSRKKSTVGRSPAAVYVISNEMIRRSAANSIPEVLRMAPGVQVARINSHQWAISIRGFNGLYSNKLQVQIDGRSVYTPLYGGVFWNAQNIPLADIERIEIIRGPGASVWGANAVNGIINVITKNAEDTQGLLVQGGTGTLERGHGTIRYGSTNGNGVSSRVYGTWVDRDHTSSATQHDNWMFGQTGFRTDIKAEEDDRFTIQGDFFKGEVNHAYNFPSPVTGPPFAPYTPGIADYLGANGLLRWEHEYSDTSESALQVYYDRTEFDVGLFGPAPGFTSSIDTFDVDFQHSFQLADAHALLWGAGYQHVSSHATSSPGFLDFRSPDRYFNRISGFIQDEITLLPEEVFLTLGTKLSYNSFTGVEVQPTARWLWLPDERHSVWAAVSRAVRVPTISEVDADVALSPVSTGIPGVFPRQISRQALTGQDVMSYEMGMRGQPVDEFSWDATVFINRYDNLGVATDRGLAPVPGNPLAVYFVQEKGNGGSGESYGAELAAAFEPTERTTWRASYSYIQIFGTADQVAAAPRNQLYLQSSTKISQQVDGDIIWRYVDSIPGVTTNYNVLDLRLAWTPTDSLEWAVMARGLLDDKHPEFQFSPIGDVTTEIPTEVYTTITWQY